ncbi:MAG TPA: NUDIX hydrolase [Maritimibacter sp.]|nr:NUDIX hydrolase [Maritimibacter sp.]
MTRVSAAMAVVVQAGQVLLVKRKKQPDAGLWGYPGGHVELGETPLDAAARELWEETGVTARAETVLDVLPIDAPGYAFDLAAVLCAYETGDPVAADDAAAAAWVAVTEVLEKRLEMSQDVDRVLRLAMAHVGPA